jgi:hypothetical protein
MDGSPNRQEQSGSEALLILRQIRNGSAGKILLRALNRLSKRNVTLNTGRRIRLGVLACSAIPLNAQSIPH